MKRILIIILLMIGYLGLSFGQQTSQAKDKDNWVKIGETTLNLSQDYGIFDWDRDRDQTEKVNANDKYSAIKFRAKDSKVSLTNVEVQYDNGKKEEMKLDTPIEANNDSKILQLDTRSDLDKVTFNFLKDEHAAKDKAVVEIWGLKASGSGMGQRDIETDKDLNMHKDMQKDIDKDLHKDLDHKDVDRDINKNVNVDVDTAAVKVP